MAAFFFPAAGDFAGFFTAAALVLRTFFLLTALFTGAFFLAATFLAAGLRPAFLLAAPAFFVVAFTALAFLAAGAAAELLDFLRATARFADLAVPPDPLREAADLARLVFALVAFFALRAI